MWGCWRLPHPHNSVTAHQSWLAHSAPLSRSPRLLFPICNKRWRRIGIRMGQISQDLSMIQGVCKLGAHSELLLDDVLRCNVGNWRRLLIIIRLDSLALQNLRWWLVAGLLCEVYLGTRPETSQRLMAPSQQLLSVIDKMATKLNTCCCGSGFGIGFWRLCSCLL